MSLTTRVNGDFEKFTEGQLYSIYQQKAIVVAVKNAGGVAVDLSAEDSDAQGEVDQAVAIIVKEIQPLMYILKGAAHNEIHAIIDGHAVDVDTLQARIRHLAPAGINGIDVSGSTVVVGSSITVA